MKNLFLIFAIFAALTLTTAAQKMVKPTLTPTEATPAQKQLIQRGARLHDEGQYDEAIKLYQQVLNENPTNDQALYETALSYYNKKDFAKSQAAAYKLIQYKSDTGVLGYGLIANVLDDQGKPKEAIAIYRQAIKLLQDTPEMRPHLSSLYYNLGVTYSRQKQFKDAREALKTAVQQNFSYVSPHYLLAEVFYANGYKIPAMLAAARTVSLEINSDRAASSADLVLQTLKAKKNEKTGNINIFVDPNAPTDEGNFAAFDIILGTLTAVKTDADKGKTDEEIFAQAVDTFVGLLAEDKKLAATFVGKTYVPFMVEMQQRGYTKTFAYLVLLQKDNEPAKAWLQQNKDKTLEFLNWAKKYQLK